MFFSNAHLENHLACRLMPSHLAVVQYVVRLVLDWSLLSGARMEMFSISRPWRATSRVLSHKSSQVKCTSRVTVKEWT
jgi:hypothetical protein